MVAMRFRKSDYAAIKKKSNKANMNFTEFVTASALNKPITVIDGLDDILKEQKAIGRNLNQLTTLCNMGKIVCPDLTELIQQYGTVYGKITDDRKSQKKKTVRERKHGQKKKEEQNQNDCFVMKM